MDYKTIAGLIAPSLTKFVNSKTTIGKTGKAGLYVSVAISLIVLLTAIAGNPALFTWQGGILVVLANILLVFIKNWLDSSTPNF